MRRTFSRCAIIIIIGTAVERATQRLIYVPTKIFATKIGKMGKLPLQLKTQRGTLMLVYVFASMCGSPRLTATGNFAIFEQNEVTIPCNLFTKCLETCISTKHLAYPEKRLRNNGSLCSITPVIQGNLG